MIARFITEAIMIHNNRDDIDAILKAEGYNFPFFYLNNQKAKILSDGKPGNWFVKKFPDNNVIFCCSFSHNFDHSLTSNNLKIVAKTVVPSERPDDPLDAPASYEEKFGEVINPRKEKEAAKKYAIGAREAVKNLSRMPDLKSAVDLLWKLAEESTK